jgi:hypothetical protein
MSNNVPNESEESQKAIIAAATKKVLSETKPLETSKSTTTKKSITETSDSDNVTPPNSAEIDLENEPIQQKRDRQRTLVLNLGNQKKISIFFSIIFY